MTGEDPRAGGVTVREAKQTDRSVVRALQGVLPSPAPDLLDLAFAGGGAATVLVAERDRVLGYALALSAAATHTQVVYLAELVVAPGARRGGIGKRLISALPTQFPEGEELRATARDGDARALAFYQAVGFQRVEELPDHYDDADGILLARGLGP